MTNINKVLFVYLLGFGCMSYGADDKNNNNYLKYAKCENEAREWEKNYWQSTQRWLNNNDPVWKSLSKEQQEKEKKTAFCQYKHDQEVRLVIRLHSRAQQCRARPNAKQCNPNEVDEGFLEACEYVWNMSDNIRAAYSNNKTAFLEVKKAQFKEHRQRALAEHAKDLD